MLRELKTFLEVTRCGTFAAAGDRIGLTQSAVSAQMQRLEEALGYPLFERAGRSAQLTAEGRAAIGRAEQILDLFGGMCEGTESRPIRGEVRLGAVSTAQAGLLPVTMSHLRRAGSEISLRIIPGSSLQLLALVDSGEIDAAILVEPPFALPRELNWSPLANERYALIAPHDAHESDWRALITAHRFIRYDRSAFGGRLVERFLRRHRLHVNDCAEMDELTGIVKMVEEGLGVALLPISPGLDVSQVRVFELKGDVFYRRIGVIERSEPRSAVFSLFSRALGEAAHELYIATSSLG
ncbi:Transcriptional regulator [Hahella chejuensis KCTC 2396]|uniref:Transcriptional regulator n=1 Tax=Hahella chejuensis (strain KCTC 2396) TaxID=349521 RepID=Q2SLQ5_HAHCH|nr:LysR family transcriptional regulator [Hahella chejuensis]ABC28419.1 Transcriptional regulator [Hahella chejuensis KCTC 2396]